MAPFYLGQTLSRTMLIQGEPPANGRLGKGAEEGEIRPKEDKEQNCSSQMQIINYSGTAALKLSESLGSEVNAQPSGWPSLKIEKEKVKKKRRGEGRGNTQP